MSGGGPARRRARAWAGVVILVGALVASCADDPTAAPTTAPATAPEDVTTSSTSPSGATGATGAEPLGTVRPAGEPASCALPECLEVEVECPDVPAATADIAVLAPVGDQVGTIVLFSGALGNTWWANPNQRRQAGVVTQLSELGLEVVEVAWPGDGWGAAPEGTALGFARLACRPATLLRWLHDQRYAPLGLAPGTGTCGFCVSGNSGGASQVAYALAYYGLDELIDVAVLTSGPPHGAITRGCLRAPGDERFAYAAASVPLIDGAYGHLHDPGPCAAADPAFEELWQVDSIAVGGNDYVYERTRVEVLLGGQDRTVAPAHALEFVDRLETEGSPMVRLQEIPEMEHEVLAQASSREAFLSAVAGTG